MSDEAADRLRGYVAEVRRLDAEVRELDRMRRNLYVEAKGFGFNIKAIKQIARSDPGRAKHDADDLVNYLNAIGGEVLTRRLGREAFGRILFGTDEFPSEMVDLEGIDVDCGLFRSA
jgi:uncharacterized protein (UPF0335 family)